MKLIKASVVLLFAFSIFSCTTKAIDPSLISEDSYSDIDSVTLKVGDMAPSFTLSDGNGKLRSLDGLLAEKHVMLVFYRGEWCPYCISHLESFEAVLPQLAQKNVRLVAVSPDTVSTNQNTQRNFGLDYLFLSDTKHDAVSDYGVIAKAESGVPHPAIFLINQQGKVVWYFASKNIKERPTGKQMLDVITKKLK